MKPENLLNGLRAACTTIKRKFQILRIGLVRTSLFNRLTRTRRITLIREDVRLCSGLWELALARAA